jgi:3-isopropylmalate/(R)-2-methylmalate dehydratase small subunit
VLIRGRAHRFGDNVNTDYIIAAQHKSSLDLAETATHTFETIDPDFVRRVRPGDLVVAGSNFGCGSAREVAVHVLKQVGVSCVLAPTFARIFFRNAINGGLPVAECDTSEIQAGDELEVNLASGTVRNQTRGQSLKIAPLPAVMREVLEAGGIAGYLSGRDERELFVPRAAAPNPRSEERMSSSPLPKRQQPRPETTTEGHHGQIGITPVAELNAELHRRAFALPDVEERETVVSIPGTRALWLREDLPLAHPEHVSHGREFTHIHPDGSLHLTLPPERANEAVEAGWGEPPPHGHRGRHEGRILVYTPANADELEVTLRLLAESYSFITGRQEGPPA